MPLFCINVWWQNSLNLVVMLLSINRKCCLLIYVWCDLRWPQFLLFHGKYRHFSRTRQIFRRFFYDFILFSGYCAWLLSSNIQFLPLSLCLPSSLRPPVLSVSRRRLVSRRRFSLQSVSSAFYNNKGTEWRPHTERMGSSFSTFPDIVATARKL